ncbi:hypothetical protein PILCRDRAFT_826424 [Piloderma croceum F 1598]|uniref:Uncharacterized protein n=1 Tax=Piloderma croceum (strain F 1598) TaxID=765440 RepID=A0A0C3AR49_PILCF|nr:hypothetical protein PILCRDRAFT_826424 [Piloderma croceum F 1598]
MAFAPRKQNAIKTAPSHGKVGGSRPNGSTATTRSRAPSERKASKTTNSVPLEASQRASAAGGLVRPSSTTRNVPLTSSTKASTKARVVSATPSSTSASLPRKLASAPARTQDPLQVAAQLYPWLYMISSLETTFQAAELSAHNSLDERAKDIAGDEADIADQRVRFDAEQRLAFLQEFASNTLSHEVPDIMRGFLRNGDTCDKVVAEALQVGMQSQKELIGNSSLPLHNEILDKLEHAQSEANRLESSFIHLFDSVQLAASSQIRPILAACLPILRARIANLTTAQSLVESSKDNLEMILQLERLAVH